MNTSLSKSRYTKYCQCPKALWLSVNKPDEATIDAGVEARFAEGNVVASDTVEALGGSDVKRVTLKGADSLPQLEGIGAIDRDGQSVSFLYRGDIRLLIQALAGVSFEDVTVVDPPLDEVFMHYYAEEGAR